VAGRGIRIAIDCRVVSRGSAGLDRYCEELLHHLPEGLRPGDRLFALLAAAGTVPDLDPRIEVILAPDSRTVGHWLARENVDLYHLAWLSAKAGHYDGLLHSRRSVLTVPDLILYDYERHFGVNHPKPGRWHRFRRSLRAAARAASGLLVYSDHVAGQVVSRFGIDPGRVHTIPLAASPRIASPPEGASLRVRQDLGLPSRYLLAVGSDYPHKNLPLLLEGYSRFRSLPGREDVALALVGESVWPETRARLRKRIAELGAEPRVFLVDPIPDQDLAALMAGAAAFVFASREEGFGLPPLEALAAGAPLVCGRAGPLPEILGDVPEWFPVDDPDALAAAIDRLVSDPARAELQRRAAQDLLARYGWPATARRTFDVYRSVLDGPAGQVGPRLRLKASSLWRTARKPLRRSAG